jgi:hypothetical protein
MNDLKSAFRQLLKNSGFTAAAVPPPYLLSEFLEAPQTHDQVPNMERGNT